MPELHELGVQDAARAIRDGDITAEALAEALLARAQAHEDLNAFAALDPDQVRGAARKADERRKSGARLGPLHGVPLVFKDNIDTVGLPTIAGTPALRVNNPGTDAPVARALFDAGAVLLGKCGMHELAFGITSNNACFGAVCNPYDPRMIPGGSSGGTAAAVAARLAPAGIGTDTGGSVRIPAALCGLTGLRPTLKRWPQQGIVPIALTRDTAGPIARSVADLALLDGAVTGVNDPVGKAALKGLRLGVPASYYWSDLDPETARVCEQALAMLKDAGVVLVEADLPDVASLDQAVSFIVALYEPARDIGAYLEAAGSRLSYQEVVAAVASPDVKAVLESTLDPATAVSEEAYRAAINEHRPKLIAAFERYFTSNRLDATLFPTTPLPARPIGEDETVELNGRQVPTFGTFIRNTDPGSNAGLPGITLPVGRTPDGLPVGLALDAPAGADRRLLEMALALESLFEPLPAPRRRARTEV